MAGRGLWTEPHLLCASAGSWKWKWDTGCKHPRGALVSMSNAGPSSWSLNLLFQKSMAQATELLSSVLLFTGHLLKEAAPHLSTHNSPLLCHSRSSVPFQWSSQLLCFQITVCHLSLCVYAVLFFHLEGRLQQHRLLFVFFVMCQKGEALTSLSEWLSG